MIYKEELLEKLEEKYGNLNDDSGCYSGSNWFSLKAIVDIINSCEEEEG